MTNREFLQRKSPKAKLWRCGDKDRFRVPKSDKNLWKMCLEPLLEEDRLKCEAWKDEVQNLLIFAGLFSAVVTAFVIQSYQALQPAQNMNAVLLAYIASTVDNQTDGRLYEILDPSPTTSCIRVSVYWFLSLILSLITVLVGIVSLQWLREFQRYPTNLSSKKLLAMRTMRSEAFEAWFIPQIFAGLPLLLQVALVLFFVGLVDLLLPLSRQVAVPVIVLFSFTFLFLFLTTTLPSIQSFWVLNVSKRTSIPAQCPYKSPQSWAFLRLCSSWTMRLTLNCIGLILLNLAIVTLSPTVLILQIWRKEYYIARILDRVEYSLQLKYLGTLSCWNIFDDFWLDERQRIATHSTVPAGYFKKMVGNADYDAARGLAHVVNGDVREESTAFATYHCFQELPLAVVQDDIFDLMLKGLPDWIKAQKASRMSPFLKCPSNKLIRDENEAFLLARLPQTLRSGPTHVFRHRQLEVFIRTLAYIFTDEPWDHHPQIGHILTDAELRAPDATPRLLIPTPLRSVKGFASLPEPLCADLKEQLVSLWGSFIEMSLNKNAEDISALGICYKEEVLGNFMQLMHALTSSLVTSTCKGQSTAILSDLTAMVARLARSLLLDEHDANNDGRNNSEVSSLATKHLMFHIAILYLSRFDYTEWAHILHRAPEFAGAFRTLVSAAHTYEQVVVGQVIFSLHNQYYQRQWRELFREVLSDSERAADLDEPNSDTIPASDCRIDIIEHPPPY